MSPNVVKRANVDACRFKGSIRRGSGVSLVRPNETTWVERRIQFAFGLLDGRFFRLFYLPCLMTGLEYGGKTVLIGEHDGIRA